MKELKKETAFQIHETFSPKTTHVVISSVKDGQDNNKRCRETEYTLKTDANVAAAVAAGTWFGNGTGPITYRFSGWLPSGVFTYSTGGSLESFWLALYQRKPEIINRQFVGV